MGVDDSSLQVDSSLCGDFIAVKTVAFEPVSLSHLS